ncbi:MULTISPECIES: DUF2165 family protein [Pseudomonas]|uniref:DUF2165 family protein n=1 Tax=Pseudomonas auratipiscis TaxID=3115853 RepID=A0AB35WTT5_9PSED|nr:MULTISPECIES: DUF2165 family protein [unclassified Pseudomonas]MEE1867571.1 DUF2165 family protein [Pseudomonas sp. 120P]MEE1958398.1 DUF2165 family protein [Pseudomonas sp. 119P]
MDTETSQLFFLAVHFLGFSLWLSIALINNLQAFSASVGAVGATLSMAPLKQHPRIDIPLLKRSMDSPALHKLALSIIVLLQLAAVVSAWTGCYNLVFGDSLEVARSWLNLSLSAALGSIFAMLLGGLWFGYWIRQEGLQLTHLALVLWMMLSFILLNSSWLS